jgi:hypothetical protein
MPLDITYCFYFSFFICLADCEINEKLLILWGEGSGIEGFRDCGIEEFSD